MMEIVWRLVVTQGASIACPKAVKLKLRRIIIFCLQRNSLKLITKMHFFHVANYIFVFDKDTNLK